jgi:hypothetical protein
MFKELPTPLQDELKKKNPYSSNPEHDLHAALLRLYAQESRNADKEHLAKESEHLVEMIATIGQYYSPNHVLRAAILSTDNSLSAVGPSPGEAKVKRFLDFIDSTYGLKHRGASYVILTIGFATWVFAFISKARVSVLTLQPSEFITVLVAGLILMLAAVGIRIYEYIVRTRVALSDTDADEETASN